MKNFINSLLAGILITIGCSVFLNVNNYIGAILFSIALYTICIKDYFLYTGKVGFIIQNKNIKTLLIGLLGNIISTIVFGLIISYASPIIVEKAKIICENKIFNQNWIQTFIKATMCGILMYIAVDIYKNKNSILGIFLAVPVFILSGFEHSIANIGYFSIANMFSIDVIIFILISILGNSVGALILPLLEKIREEMK